MAVEPPELLEVDEHENPHEELALGDRPGHDVRISTPLEYPLGGPTAVAEILNRAKSRYASLG